MTRCCRPDCWRLFADVCSYDRHRDESGACVDPATVLYLDRPVFRAGRTPTGSVVWSLNTETEIREMKPIEITALGEVSS